MIWRNDHFATRFASTNLHNWEFVSGWFAGPGSHFGGIWGSWGAILAPFWSSLGAKMHSVGSLRVPAMIFSDLRSSLGGLQASLWGHLLVIFDDLRHQKACLDCRHDSSWFLMRNPIYVWCPNLSEVWQILLFSLDFAFLTFCWFEWLQAPVWISFGSLWRVLEHQFGVLLGYCTGIEILMNFRVSPEPPKAERIRQVDGKLAVQAVQ